MEIRIQSLMLGIFGKEKELSQITLIPKQAIKKFGACQKMDLVLHMYYKHMEKMLKLLSKILH